MLDKTYLIEEINRSLKWFSLKGLVSLVWIVAVGFALFFAFQSLMTYLEQRGWSKRLHVPMVRVLFNLIFPILFVINATFFMARRSFLFEMAGLICLSAILVVFLVELSRGLLPAIGMLLTAGLGEGDWIQVGDKIGRLKRVGLFRCQLVSHSGESHYIPTRSIGRLGLKRLPKGMVHPLEMELNFEEGKVDSVLLSKLEKHLFLSPYRAKSGGLRLDWDHGRQVKVTMELISDKHQDLGEAFVKRVRDLVLEDKPKI